MLSRRATWNLDTMITALLIFFGLLIAGGFVTILVVYLRYLSSPAAQWKRRVYGVAGRTSEGAAGNGTSFGLER